MRWEAGGAMTCVCSLQLRSLLSSLPSIPPLGGLLPPLPPALFPAISAAIVPPALAAMPAPPLASADAALLANLSTMASLTAAVKATSGLNLALPVPPMALASLQATLTAQINSLNANGGVLNLGVPNLADLLNALTPLMQLAGLVAAVQAAFHLDLRSPGAIAALQARLDATARAAVTARASATATMSAVGMAMASLGYPATPQGAAALTAAMTAMAGWTQRLPVISVNFNALSLLAALLAALAAILSALGVNLRAPNALASLRVALGALPLAGLASLRLTALAQTQVSMQASASASLVSSLNLMALAQANLGPAARVAVLMRLTALAPLAMPPGSCGQPCPLALIPGQAA
jgi:hypothetical protein